MRPLKGLYDAPAYEEDGDDTPDPALPVSVKCPHCPRGFQGQRDRVEEDLFIHLWKVHEEPSLEYMLNNMLIPSELRERIFEEMGPDYVSWLVDTEGEIVEDR